MAKYIEIDEYTEQFLTELYKRVENNTPDNSLEYSEEKDQVLYSLGKQLVTGEQGEGSTGNPF